MLLRWFFNQGITSVYIPNLRLFLLLKHQLSDHQLHNLARKKSNFSSYGSGYFIDVMFARGVFIISPFPVLLEVIVSLNASAISLT